MTRAAAGLQDSCRQLVLDLALLDGHRLALGDLLYDLIDRFLSQLIPEESLLLDQVFNGGIDPGAYGSGRPLERLVLCPSR
jgi:hypothetical protein